MELACKGRLPVPRSFHTATAVGKRVVVMGGRAQDNKHLADFNVYDTGKYLTNYVLYYTFRPHSFSQSERP